MKFHGRHEDLQRGTAHTVKVIEASTTEQRTRRLGHVLEEIREENGRKTVICRDPVARKVLRKRARAARSEFDAQSGLAPREFTVAALEKV